MFKNKQNPSTDRQYNVLIAKYGDRKKLTEVNSQEVDHGIKKGLAWNGPRQLQFQCVSALST